MQGFSVRRRVTIRRKDTTPSVPRKLSPKEVRAKVVEEILNTERDYVRNLEDIMEVFALFQSVSNENAMKQLKTVYKVALLLK